MKNRQKKMWGLEDFKAFWSNVGLIFRKELKESFRDRTQVMMIYGLPLLFLPLGTLFLSETALYSEARSKKEILKVHLAGHPEQNLLEWVKRNKKFQLVGLPDVPTAQWRTFFQKGEVDLVFQMLPPTPDRKFQGTLYWDGTLTKSLRALSLFKDLLRKWQKERRLLQDRMEGRPEGYLSLNYNLQDLSPPAKSRGKILGLFLPYLLFIIIAFTIYYPAISTILEEKEKKTIFSLLMTPASPLEIILGKIFNICTQGILGLLSYTASFLFTISLFKGGSSSSSSSSSFSVDWANAFQVNNVLSCFLALLFLIFFLAAFSFFLISLTKTTYQAQVLLSTILMSGIAVFGSIPLLELKLDFSNAWLPFMGAALMIQESLVDPVSGGMILEVLVSHGLWVALFIYFSLQIFGTEGFLFHSTLGLGELLTWGRREKTPVLHRATPSFSLLLFFISFLGTLITFGLLSRWTDPLSTAMVAQTIFLGLVPLLLSRHFRFSLKKHLPLDKPNLCQTVTTLCLDLSLWPLLILLVSLVSLPEELVKDLAQEITGKKSGLLLFKTWIMVALVPGILEEFYFRGILMKGFLGRYSPLMAILLTSFLFGIFHFSLIRLFPTILLGFILGVVVYRTRSLLAGMIFHILHNSLVMVFLYHPGGEKLLLPPENIPFALSLGVGVLFLLAGFGWFLWSTPSPYRPEGFLSSTASGERE